MAAGVRTTLLDLRQELHTENPDDAGPEVRRRAGPSGPALLALAISMLTTVRRCSSASA